MAIFHLAWTAHFNEDFGCRRGFGYSARLWLVCEGWMLFFHLKTFFLFEGCLVKWLQARPHCTAELSTLIFLVCIIKQKLLLPSNFNSEQQPTAAWWGTADGWDMLYSPGGHIDLNSAVAGVNGRDALQSYMQGAHVWKHKKKIIK